MVILAAAAALRVLLALVTPPLYAPDEAGHVLYVHQVATAFSFPVQSLNGSWADHAGANEFYQPPLYYLLAAPLYRLLMPFGDAAVYGLRIFDAALAVASIYVIYRIARVVFPERPAVQLTAAAIAALLPTFAGMGSAVNCDSLACLLIFTVTLLMLQRLASASLNWRQALLIGGLTAAALYTKTSAIVLFPSIVVLAVLLERHGYRCRLRAAVAVALPLLAIAPWWILRNLASYGDLLGVDIGWTHYGGPAFFGVIRGLWVLTFTFWIAFGRVYDAAAQNPLAVVLTAASIVLTWRAIRMLGRGDLSSRQMSMAALLGLQFVVLLAGAFQYSIRFGFTEGRYVYPALPALVLTVAYGLTSFKFSRTPATARAVLAVMGAVCAGLLVFSLLPAFESVTVDAAVGGPMYAGHTGNYDTWIAHRAAPLR